LQRSGIRYYIDVSSDFSAFERIRFYVTVFSGLLFTGGFYGVLEAIGAKYFLSLSEQNALLIFGLPVAFLVASWMAPKMPKILGFTS
jgi:hypothetical protein